MAAPGEKSLASKIGFRVGPDTLPLALSIDKIALDRVVRPD